ncbi:MAG: ABC transporter substrate-binding protein [Thermoplasmatales archaeon]|nr:ABC transporter substrate-binding protein [Thermoplasmatales archaeon]MCW6171063.1 ABC transporter substrate-binding protein [Thermoplasmatales archaeon]
MKTIKIIITVVVVAIVVVAGALAYEHFSRTPNDAAQNTLTPVTSINLVNNGSTTKINLSAANSFVYAKDTNNGVFTIHGSLSRIVSLIPSVTVTLYALGSYQKDVKGVDQYSTYPNPSNYDIPVLTIGVSSLPIEAIVNLSPDAIMTTTGYFTTQEISKVVNVLNIPYFVFNPESVPQIENANTILGELTGTAHNATIINAWMEKNLQKLGNLTKKITNETSIFYDLGHGSSGIYTAGNGTFINEMFQLDHIKNIINATGYPEVSRETVYNGTPGFVLIDEYVNQSRFLKDFPNLTAVKDKNYTTVLNDSFIDEPTFRTIYALFWIGSVVYPNYINITDITGFNNYTHFDLSPAPHVGIYG